MIKVFTLVLWFFILSFTILLADDEAMILSQPSVQNSISLKQALNRSRNYREYAVRSITLAELSEILWAAGGRRYDGVTMASRTYPSAGSIYPVRLYVLVGAVERIKPGIYQYLSADHALILLKPGDYRKGLVEGSWQAGFAAHAPVTVVQAADFNRTTLAFGERGKLLYVPLEAGHSSQNLRLAAAALGIGVGIAGEFNHTTVKDLLGIELEPLLILTLGPPL